MKQQLSENAIYEGITLMYLHLFATFKQLAHFFSSMNTNVHFCQGCRNEGY